MQHFGNLWKPCKILSNSNSCVIFCKVGTSIDILFTGSPGSTPKTWPLQTSGSWTRNYCSTGRALISSHLQLMRSAMIHRTLSLCGRTQSTYSEGWWPTRSWMGVLHMLRGTGGCYVWWWCCVLVCKCFTMLYICSQCLKSFWNPCYKFTMFWSLFKWCKHVIMCFVWIGRKLINKGPFEDEQRTDWHAAINGADFTLAGEAQKAWEEAHPEDFARVFEEFF